ncbi:MAG: competence/damage-inducible protein A, partial [Gammaproteobacteria bacterium]|nr:competence/damage-inducible protein A [Gemmatimonadota bacterium]NIT86145.1 competence/damage-inducible protein A [Gemmatimonadota bacterium]NIU76737.1 competence/damage-inducible protein A [Gammaproteobacteria bacterium]NIX38415.1 competence/damage-inducible protein A [Gemmatimonadota bacterium]
TPGRSEGRTARAVIVTVGDELLLGETVDTNSAWLARELHRLGMAVVAKLTAGDRDSEIQGAVAAGLERGDAVLVTGGLGPTPDDVTRRAVASLLERDLRVDERLRDALEARFRARGYDRMPETNLRQVEVPTGARILPNPIGTASALVLEEGEKHIILFPGVPAELKRIFVESAAPYLRETFVGRL